MDTILSMLTRRRNMHHQNLPIEHRHTTSFNISAATTGLPNYFMTNTIDNTTTHQLIEGHVNTIFLNRIRRHSEDIRATIRMFAFGTSFMTFTNRQIRCNTASILLNLQLRSFNMTNMSQMHIIRIMSSTDMQHSFLNSLMITNTQTIIMIMPTRATTSSRIR